MARKTRKRRPRRRRNAWKGDTAGHRRAARKGWRKRKRRRNPRSNDWPGQPRRHARAARKGWRRRRRRNPVANAPRRRRRRSSPRRRNQWYGQPRRHARAARKGWSRRRRARRNPPRRHHYNRRRYALRNPSNPIAAITGMFEEAFSTDTLETILQTGLGLGGSLVGTKLLGDAIPALKDDAGRIGASVGVSIIGAGIAGMIADRTVASRFLVGGLLGSFLQILGIVLKDAPEARAWIPTVGLGQESEEFKSAIEEEVLKELRAGAAGMGDDYIAPAGVENYIPAAGTSAYLTEMEAERAIEAPEGMMGLGAYLTEREAERAVTSPVGMMGHDTDPIGSQSSLLSERF